MNNKFEKINELIKVFGEQETAKIIKELAEDFRKDEVCIDFDTLQDYKKIKSIFGNLVENISDEELENDIKDSDYQPVITFNKDYIGILFEPTTLTNHMSVNQIVNIVKEKIDELIAEKTFKDELNNDDNTELNDIDFESLDKEELVHLLKQITGQEVKENKPKKYIENIKLDVNKMKENEMNKMLDVLMNNDIRISGLTMYKYYKALLDTFGEYIEVLSPREYYSKIRIGDGDMYVRARVTDGTPRIIMDFSFPYGEKETESYDFLIYSVKDRLKQLEDFIFKIQSGEIKVIKNKLGQLVAEKYTLPNYFCSHDISPMVQIIELSNEDKVENTNVEHDIIENIIKNYYFIGAYTPFTSLEEFLELKNIFKDFMLYTPDNEELKEGLAYGEGSFVYCNMNGKYSIDIMFEPLVLTEVVTINEIKNNLSNMLNGQANFVQNKAKEKLNKVSDSIDEKAFRIKLGLVPDKYMVK